MVSASNGTPKSRGVSVSPGSGKNAILGSTQRAGYFFLGSEVNERNTGLNVSFDALRDLEGNVSLRVRANFSGVEMLTDSEPSFHPTS